MNTLKNFEKDVEAVVQETLDLCLGEVDLTVERCRYRFEAIESGAAVTVISDPDNLFRQRQGIHHEYDKEDFDEYKLADLLEQAWRDGFDKIYIYPRKAA